MALFGSVLRAGSLVGQVARDLRTATDGRLAPFGLTTQQAALLLYAASGPASPNELAAAVGTDTAGATRLIDRLERKGLLVRHRHPTDRRGVVIEVTPAGLALVPQVSPVFGQVSSALVEGFTEEELSQLSGLMARMSANLRTGGSQPRPASNGAAEVD